MAERKRSTVRDLRRDNRSVLLWSLFFTQPCSRQDLSWATGLSAGELDRPSFARFMPADAMQGAMVSEVLRDAKVGIECALLKDDPELSESRAAVARDVATENAHSSRPAHIEVRNHRE